MHKVCAVSLVIFLRNDGQEVKSPVKELHRHGLAGCVVAALGGRRRRSEGRRLRRTQGRRQVQRPARRLDAADQVARSVLLLRRGRGAGPVVFAPGV